MDQDQNQNDQVEETEEVQLDENGNPIVPVATPVDGDEAEDSDMAIEGDDEDEVA